MRSPPPPLSSRRRAEQGHPGHSPSFSILFPRLPLEDPLSASPVFPLLLLCSPFFFFRTAVSVGVRAVVPGWGSRVLSPRHDNSERPVPGSFFFTWSCTSFSRPHGGFDLIASIEFAVDFSFSRMPLLQAFLLSFFFLSVDFLNLR